MSDNVEFEIDYSEPELDESNAPSEVESALLSFVMFAGLVLFGLFCIVIGWS